MRRTEFLKGSLELAVLSLLRREEMNGYQIVRELNSTERGILGVGEGSIYPLLLRLETKGFLKGRWTKSKGMRRKHVYHLTGKGRRTLPGDRLLWEQVTAALRRIVRATI